MRPLFDPVESLSKEIFGNISYQKMADKKDEREDAQCQADPGEKQKEKAAWRSVHHLDVYSPNTKTDNERVLERQVTPYVFKSKTKPDWNNHFDFSKRRLFMVSGSIRLASLLRGSCSSTSLKQSTAR